LCSQVVLVFLPISCFFFVEFFGDGPVGFVEVEGFEALLEAVDVRLKSLFSSVALCGILCGFVGDGVVEPRNHCWRDNDFLYCLR